MSDLRCTSLLVLMAHILPPVSYRKQMEISMERQGAEEPYRALLMQRLDVERSSR
jgi:hypothetical protein